MSCIANGRIFRPHAVLRASGRILNQHILPIAESPIGTACRDLRRRPPTFIIGPPRCGSTLAIQVLTEALEVGFISNAHAPWFGAPAAAEIALRWVRRRVPSDFRSDLGRTEGAHAPSECAAWWYRFFPRSPTYVGPGSLGDEILARFRRSVKALTAASGRPVVFKNLYASLRIHPIVAAIPESIFVVIRRNHEDIAKSLLAARLKEYGGPDRWLSVEPPNIEELRRLPVHLQVLGQARSIYELIASDLLSAGVPSRQVLEFEYDALCSDPGSCVKVFRDRLRLLGADISDRRLDRRKS